MMEETLTEKEAMFLRELEKYENQWVALVRSGDTETIVASGEEYAVAKQSAQAQGFSEPVLYKVPSFNTGYIPTITSVD